VQAKGYSLNIHIFDYIIFSRYSKIYLMRPILFAWLILLAPFCTSGQIISTVAGNGTAAFAGDGYPATAASLHNPMGVFKDSVGNIIISDKNNFRVRRVSTSGIISTIVGNGAGGYTGDGGPALAAAISSPEGIDMGPDGSLYIGISSVGYVRRVGPDGNMYRYAGNNTFMYSGDGGPATAAGLHGNARIVADTLGNVYIADATNQRVRMVNTAGIISTVAGTGVSGFSGDGGPATAAKLNNPYGLAIDKMGNLFICDGGNKRIRKVNPAGVISTVAGNGAAGSSGDGGPATSASIFPYEVAVDRYNNIIIVDIYRIRIVNSAGYIYTIAGNGVSTPLGDGGPATDAGLSSPRDAFVDTSGNLYIAEEIGNRVRVVTGAICVNTPTAGTIASALASDCYSYNLSLPTATVGFGIEYQWSFSPDGVSFTDIPGATLSTYAAGIAGPSYHRCRVICANTGLSSTTPIIYHAVPGPAAASALPLNAAFCSGVSALLTANAVAPGVTYQWRKDGFAIPGATNSTYTATTQGLYSVMETNALGCSSYSVPDTVTRIESALVPDTAICTGSAITLTHASSMDTVDAYNNFIFSARDPATSLWNIWRKNTITGVYQPLFSDGYNRNTPVVSADGNELIYVRYRTQVPDAMTFLNMDSAWVCRSNANGTNEKIVFLVPEYKSYAIYGMDWTADKRHIIFDKANLSSLSSAPVFKGDVYMFDYATDRITNITVPDATWRRNCKFGPGDSVIAFTHHAASWSLYYSNIFKMSATGTGTTVITTTGGAPTDESICLLADYPGLATVLYRRSYSGSLYEKSLTGTETLVTAAPGFGGRYLGNGIYAAADTFNNIKFFHMGGSVLGSVNIPAISKFKDDPDYKFFSQNGSDLVWLGPAYVPRVTYLWSTGATTADITVTPSATTTYSCTSTVNGVACADAVIVSTDTPLAVPTIPGDGYVCIGWYESLHASVPGGSWSASNGNASVNASGLVYGEAVGTVVISYTVSNSCGTVTATHPMEVISGVPCSDGIKGTKMSYNAVSVVPNPSDGSFSVDINGSINADYGIDILNVLGSLVETRVSHTNHNYFTLSEPPGTYLVRVRLADRVYTQRLVIVR
jgi:hypothetical protein